MSEYHEEINNSLVIDNIFNAVNTYCQYNNAEVSESYPILHNLLDTLINTLIINRKFLYKKHVLIDKIEKTLISNMSETMEFQIVRILNILRKLKYGNLKEINEILNFRVKKDRIHRLPPLSVEKKLAIKERVENTKYTKQPLRKQKKYFEVGEMVGARDKENKWWLAKILDVYTHDSYPDIWYYVHFEGWSNLHDEFIPSSTFRIRKYYHNKYKYKRSINIRNQISNQDSLM